MDGNIPRPPAEVKLLITILLWVASWNLLRFLQAILNWDTLANYQESVGPLYLALSGAVWSLAGFILSWYAWWGKPWAWGTILGAVVGYGAWSFCDRIFLQITHGNGPFNLLLSFVELSILLSLLYSRYVRDFYHDHKS